MNRTYTSNNLRNFSPLKIRISSAHAGSTVCHHKLFRFAGLDRESLTHDAGITTSRRGTNTEAAIEAVTKDLPDGRGLGGEGPIESTHISRPDSLQASNANHPASRVLAQELANLRQWNHTAREPVNLTQKKRKAVNMDSYSGDGDDLHVDDLKHDDHVSISDHDAGLKREDDGEDKIRKRWQT